MNNFSNHENYKKSIDNMMKYSYSKYPFLSVSEVFLEMNIWIVYKLSFSLPWSATWQKQPKGERIYSGSLFRILEFTVIGKAWQKGKSVTAEVGSNSLKITEKKPLAGHRTYLKVGQTIALGFHPSNTGLSEKPHLSKVRQSLKTMISTETYYSDPWVKKVHFISKS